MEKMDLTRQYRHYYTASAIPQIIEIEPAQYLSITGKGDPSEPEFAAHIEALYATAYTLKFDYKTRHKDFTVAKLEGLWWYDEANYPGRTIAAATDVPRSEWEYRLLIRLPDYITPDAITAAQKTVMAKKKLQLADCVTFFEMAEGSCVQMLHTGPFATETTTLRQMAAFMDANRMIKNGLHHEIYLSDFRKTPPEKLRTILREPFRQGS